ncbi:MAG: 3'-5' exoribonuclease [Bacteroidetes bacterium]|nr:3'-5' exoribonuclease [Bacteroidota bacterium]
MKLAVIDVETTGLNPNENRMTEIGIVLMEDGVVTGRFESLVNPEVHIPDHVQRLTGIRDAMVKKQPLFSEIAALVNDMTGECIIVGHNVNFDYSFLKNEMKLAGIAFSRKTLCTIELTKYLYTDLNSYSLSALCRKFKIDNRNPHRALPDAEVTAALVLKLLDKIEPDFVERLFSKKSNLVPDHLQETVYKILPSTTGVYYFIGKSGKPVYIGKATNIRNRVLSHFRGDGNSLKILSLGAQIKKIVFTETGSELLASLLEDHEIRHFWPSLNRAQKKHIVRFGIVAYMDQKHRWRLNIATSGKMNCFIVFSSIPSSY